MKRNPKRNVGDSPGNDGGDDVSGRRASNDTPARPSLGVKSDGASEVPASSSVPVHLRI